MMKRGKRMENRQPLTEIMKGSHVHTITAKPFKVQNVYRLYLMMYDEGSAVKRAMGKPKPK